MMQEYVCPVCGNRYESAHRALCCHDCHRLFNNALLVIRAKRQKEGDERPVTITDRIAWAKAQYKRKNATMGTCVYCRKQKLLNADGFCRRCVSAGFYEIWKETGYTPRHFSSYNDGSMTFCHVCRHDTHGVKLLPDRQVVRNINVQKGWFK